MDLQSAFEGAMAKGVQGDIVFDNGRVLDDVKIVHVFGNMVVVSSTRFDGQRTFDMSKVCYITHPWYEVKGNDNDGNRV